MDLEEAKKDFEERFGLGAFVQTLTKGAAAYDEDRHWEVNGPKYEKSKKDESEYDFLNKNRFLAGRELQNPIEKEAGELNRFLDKQANEERKFNQEPASLMAAGGGLALANAGRNRVIGMENRYHGTGVEAAKNIRQNGLSANFAGEGVSTKNANLAGRIGEDALKGKVYLAKQKLTATDFALQAGLANNGVENGNISKVLENVYTSPVEKAKTLLAANKNSDVLHARIPYNELNDGTFKRVANPELRGLSKKDYVETAGKEVIAPFMLDSQKAQINKQLSAGYDALGKGTDVIEGDVPARYFKGGEGYRGQNLSGAMDYIKKNPLRAAGGVGMTAGGLGLAGAGAYGVYDGVRDRVNARQQKEAEEMNRFLYKQANEDKELEEALAWYGGAAGGVGASFGASAVKSIREAGPKGPQGIHPDIDKIQAREAMKERARQILKNQGRFAVEAYTANPVRSTVGLLGGGALGVLALQAHRAHQENLAEEQLPKEAFAQIRSDMEKIAGYYKN